MTVTFVSKQNNKKELLPDQTNYLLPFSGKILIRDISSPLVFVNGDAYPVENRGKDFAVEDQSLEMAVDGIQYTVRILCRELSNETKFDYNVLLTAFQNNLVNGSLDEEILFSAFEEDDEIFRISLCTFNRKFESITRELDVESIAECVEKFPHIFQKPKQHLKQVNEVRPAAVVCRIGQESISHLASHSEHWKGIKVSGLVPERLLARILEDDYAIYENRAVKTLVDKLYKEMKALNNENIDCSMQMDMDDGLSLSSEQKSYFHARELLMRGMNDDSIMLNQMLLDDQRKTIEHILEKLGQCRSTPLYRTLKRQKPVTGRLKRTNIFMMDKYYKEAYRLWELLSQKQEFSVYDEIQDIGAGYEIFCKILFVFALRYFSFEPDPETDTIMEESRFVTSGYHFKDWRLDVTDEYIPELDVNAFKISVWKEEPVVINVAGYGVTGEKLREFQGIEAKGDFLVCFKSMDNAEQEALIRKLKPAWPSNKAKRMASEFKQKLYAAISNYENDYHDVLLVPWKYPLPDNIEEARQTLLQLKEKLPLKENEKAFILTISRPNEFTSIKDPAALNQMLTYGWADEITGVNQSNYGVLPVCLGDINSYRRYTKVLLEQMVASDKKHETCPICGSTMNKGQGNNSNLSECRSCGFQIIDTKCSNCGKEFTFTRYVPPKVSVMESDLPGFQTISHENELGYKNITEAYIDNGQINPVCPCCGR